MALSKTESLLLETPARLDAVRDAARALRAFLSDHGLDEGESHEWEMVAVEAGNNAVLYVPDPQRQNGVRFLVNAYPDAVELCVTDFGEGFELPEDIELPPDDSERGRGLFLLSALTDSMRYVRGNRENYLVLRRTRQYRRPITDVQRDADLEETLALMTEELAASYESLNAIFRFSSDLGRCEDSRSCAAKWLTELMRVTRTQWYLLRQCDSKTGGLKVVSAGSSLALLAAPEMVLEKAKQSASIEIEAAEEGRDVWLDASTDADALRNLTEVFGYPLSGMTHPIFVGTQLYGILSIGVFASRADFSVSQIKVIHTFADFLGLQLSNEEVRQEAIQSRLVTRELQVATNIQRSLLPEQLPHFEGFTLAAHSQSAHAVGGDFYDIIEVGTDGALLAIADVMGKGVPAAMFAAMFRTHLRANTEFIRTPGRMLAWLNHALFPDLDRVDMFVTAQLAYFDKTSGQITLASAGHPPALLVHGDCGEVIELSGDGPPLGITGNPVYVEERVKLEHSARLLMLTDGLIDARDPANHPLGTAPVSETFLKAALQRDTTAQKVREDLLALAAAHQRETPPADDVTFLLLVESGSPQNPNA